MKPLTIRRPPMTMQQAESRVCSARATLKRARRVQAEMKRDKPLTPAERLKRPDDLRRMRDRVARAVVMEQVASAHIWRARHADLLRHELEIAEALELLGRQKASALRSQAAVRQRIVTAREAFENCLQRKAVAEIFCASRKQVEVEEEEEAKE